MGEPARQFLLEQRARAARPFALPGIRCPGCCGCRHDRRHGTPALAPPTITPNGGTFFSTVNVTLEAPAANAAIYYSLDGSLPTTNSFRYSGTFSLASNVTINASAFESNYDNSVAESALFFVQPLHFTSSSFLANGQLQLGFAGAPGSNYVLQATTNFSNWTPISTNNAVTNPFSFFDPDATNFNHRFYRVRQQ